MVHKVLLIDSQKLVRDGIHAILERSGRFRVEAEADNGHDALRLARQSGFDLAVLGVETFRMQEQQLTWQLVEHCAGLRVIVLSNCDDEYNVMEALRSGASGYVLKQASAGEFLEALRRVAEGGSYFSPQVHEYLMAYVRRGDPPGGCTSRSLRLTPRELEVLRLVTDGHASREISRMLDLSVATVRSYRKSLMKKLGVNHVAALVQVAVREGLTGWTHSASGSYT